LIERFLFEVKKSYNDDFDKKIIDEFWKKFINSRDFYKLIPIDNGKWTMENLKTSKQLRF